MNASQRVTVELSEARQKINELLQVETRSTEQQTELEKATATMMQREPELRAAIAAEAAAVTVTDDPTGRHDPEVRERLSLRSKTGLGDFLAAAAGGRSVTGAAAEYAAATGCGDFQRVPLALFKDGRPAPVETRAITPGPAVDGMVMPAVPYVFERSAAAALGIQMPMVAPGATQIPRVTTAPPADTVAKDGAAPNTAAAVTLDSQSPKRVAGSFEVRVEDLAVFPMLEDVLMEAMRGALGNELDEQTFNGTNSGGDLNGLFQQATDVAIAGAAETYATGMNARFAALVDGTHAYTLSDVRAVIGPSTYAKYMGLFHGGSGDVTLADYLMTHLGSFRVSDRMPAVANDGQKGIVTLTAGSSPARIHVWSALEVIRDPYSGAGAGKVTLTATALLSDVYVPHGVSMVKEIHPKLS